MLVAYKREKPDHNLNLIPIIPYAYHDNPVIYKQFTDNNVNQPK